jgi:CheY-like chemotaxis protein
MSSVRVLLADDHTLLRKGLHSLLQTLPGIQVVAEAMDGVEALRLLREQQPNVVLMNISMNGLTGLDATKQAVQEFPRVRIIILSMHLTGAYVVQAVRAGAAGYKNITYGSSAVPVPMTLVDDTTLTLEIPVIITQSPGIKLLNVVLKDGKTIKRIICVQPR